MPSSLKAKTKKTRKVCKWKKKMIIKSKVN